MILKTILHVLLVVIYVTLGVKTLKKCMYIWVTSIGCPKLTSLYINYTTNGFVPVVQKYIIYIILPVRTSSLHKSILVESLVYFWAYILASRVYFSRVDCLFFEPTSLICEYILVKSLVYFSGIFALWVYLVESLAYFSGLHPHLASKF